METGFIKEIYPDIKLAEELCRKKESFARVPVYTVLYEDFPDPIEAFLRLRSGPGFMLESLKSGDETAGYSILGFDITSHIRIDGDGDPVESTRVAMKDPGFVDTGILHFPGGYAGYFSYDAVYSIYPDRFPGRAKSSGFPAAEFLRPQDFLIYDHPSGSLYVASTLVSGGGADFSEEYNRAARRITEMVRILRSPEKIRRPGPAGNHEDDIRNTVTFVSPVGKGRYSAMVEDARRHIYAGDIFQAVVSRKFDCGFESDPFTVYRALRDIEPGPYMYFLDFGTRQVVGASPEMLVRCKKGEVMTVPIAGTRPRGRTPEEDHKLSEEMVSDEKERSEHVMLVDLARNDIGRVSKFGTVRVNAFMEVEKFSHVQHMVSSVKGELKDGLDGLDAFRSCFPAGTVSGAPKIRAMELIDDIEIERRGLYAGAVGFVTPDADLDFAIAIRTVVAENGRLTLQAGAGIVAASVPENEFYETESKAAGMIQAVGAAGGFL